MSIRKITKALAGVEDILMGSETVVQTRNGQEITITGLSAQSIPLDTQAGIKLGDMLYANAGTPEGAVIADPGSICINTSGGASTTLYVKESGTGATGWIAK